jgi:ElaB/YqjD/DUF883 family membrane-anchored ribosome-binding protein
MATATNEVRSGDIDKIKEDLQRLRDDVSKLLGHVGTYGKGKVGGTRDKVGATAEDLQGRVYSRVQDVTRSVTDRGRQAASASRGKVQERPFTSIAAAFAAGLVLASLFAWKR